MSSRQRNASSRQPGGTRPSPVSIIPFLSLARSKGIPDPQGFLIGRLFFLIEKIFFLIGKKIFLIEKDFFLIGKSRFLVGKFGICPLSLRPPIGFRKLTYLPRTTSQEID